MYDQALQQFLESILLPERVERIKQVLAQRTRHVTVVLEDIWQAQNASAAIRTSECMGLQEIHVIKNQENYKINKQVVKGANKWIEVNKYSKFENNTHTCLSKLKDRGYKIVATLPSENATMLTDLNVEEKTAFVFGTEKDGVSDEVLKLCDTRIAIPMFGFTESYNISVSVAICLFHFLHEAKKRNILWQLSVEEQHELMHKWTKQSIRKCDLVVQEFYTRHGGKNQTSN